MRKLIVNEYITLDGIIEAPEGWQFPYLSEDVAQVIQAQIHDADAILLGRTTYEIFAASWPERTNNEFGVAEKLNRMPKYVVSSTLKKVEWKNSNLIQGDIRQGIDSLKGQPGGNISIIGSAGLVQSLMGDELIDEYQLLVHPLVLGKGKRLFPDEVYLSLKLVEVKAFSSGVVLLRYLTGAK